MKSHYPDPRPGIQFRDGKLYRFDHGLILVMAPWPQPRAWVRELPGGWRHDRMYADELCCLWMRPGAAMGRAEREYFSRIPDTVRRRLCRFKFRQWHGLCLVARCPGALDLLDCNPALFFALASHWVFHRPPVRHPMRAARRLVRRRQREILGWLGFPATDSARRIMARTDFSAITIPSLLDLRRLLHDDWAAVLLRHLPRVTLGVVRMLANPRYRPFVTPRLLMDTAEADGDTWDPSEALHLLYEVLQFAERRPGLRIPSKFSSLSRLRDVHRELEHAERRRYRRGMFRLPAGIPEKLPRPPYPGTAEIVPLRRLRDLQREAIAMRNCVLEHARAVAAGREYIYRVASPVRATLSVVRRAGHWVPGEMRRRDNRPVEPAVMQEVYQRLFRSAPRPRPHRDPRQLDLFFSSAAGPEGTTPSSQLSLPAGARPRSPGSGSAAIRQGGAACISIQSR